MNRTFLIFILSVFSFGIHAIGPQQYDINDFFPDAKIIATGKVISGEVKQNKTTGEVCGATFEIEIDEPIVGAFRGETVKVHHITDRRYGSLEIGSKYFFYSEDQSTHALINLGDVIDVNLNDDRPIECHQNGAAYIYREFTHKIDSEQGFTWVGVFASGAWAGIQQVVQTRDLPRVYSGLKDGKYRFFLESRDFGFQQHDMIHGGALALEPLIKLFKDEYKKSLNIKRTQELENKKDSDPN